MFVFGRKQAKPNGLGSSISHDIIVKQHSGSIEVDSQATSPKSRLSFRALLYSSEVGPMSAIGP